MVGEGTFFTLEIYSAECSYATSCRNSARLFPSVAISIYLLRHTVMKGLYASKSLLYSAKSLSNVDHQCLIEMFWQQIKNSLKLLLQSRDDDRYIIMCQRKHFFFFQYQTHHAIQSVFFHSNLSPPGRTVLNLACAALFVRIQWRVSQVIYKSQEEEIRLSCLECTTCIWFGGASLQERAEDVFFSFKTCQKTPYMPKQCRRKLKRKEGHDILYSCKSPLSLCALGRIFCERRRFLSRKWDFFTPQPRDGSHAIV